MDDLLRVDAQLVSQLTDADYPEGEVGLYAEKIENSNTHVHFNTLMIRAVKFSFMCTIKAGQTVNVWTGPGITLAQIDLLSGGDTVKALGKSPNQWIQIEVAGSEEPGWVSYSEGYMSCTPTVDLFPIVSP